MHLIMIHNTIWFDFKNCAPPPHFAVVKHNEFAFYDRHRFAIAEERQIKKKIRDTERVKKILLKYVFFIFADLQKDETNEKYFFVLSKNDKIEKKTFNHERAPLKS